MSNPDKPVDLLNCDKNLREKKEWTPDGPLKIDLDPLKPRFQTFQGPWTPFIWSLAPTLGEGKRSLSLSLCFSLGSLASRLMIILKSLDTFNRIQVQAQLSQTRPI